MAVAMDAHAVKAPGPLTASDSISLGPRMTEFIETCMRDDASLFVVLWSSATVVLGVTAVMSVCHYRSLLKRPPSLLRMYYLRITLFPLILGGCSWITLFCPRVWAFMDLMQKQAEAISLGAFGHILLLLLAEEARQHLVSGDCPEGSIGATILALLNKEGPKPHFGVPPFGCCFRRCITPHSLTPQHLLWARFFIRQYALGVVTAGLLRLWGALAFSASTYQTTSKILAFLTKLSGLLCIYGLFILYAATHEVLAKWCTTAKFVAMKAVVLLMTYQELLLGPIVDRTSLQNDHCLADSTHSEEEVTIKHREHFAGMYLIALESVLAMFLVRRAFLAAELEQWTAHQECSSIQVEVDLERLQATPKGKAGNEESGEESSDASSGSEATPTAS